MFVFWRNRKCQNLYDRHKNDNSEVSEKVCDLINLNSIVRTTISSTKSNMARVSRLVQSTNRNNNNAFNHRQVTTEPAQ